MHKNFFTKNFGMSQGEPAAKAGENGGANVRIVRKDDRKDWGGFEVNSLYCEKLRTLRFASQKTFGCSIRI